MSTTSFSGQVHQNKFLAAGSRNVNAVLVIASAGIQAAVKTSTIGRVIGIVGDQSGSMDGEKWQAAKEAIAIAVKQLPEDSEFFIIFGGDGAELFAPLQKATAANKETVLRALRSKTNSGGTYFSRWLKEARVQFAARPNAARVLIFLTDGRNEGSGENTALPGVLENCKGFFEVEARGVGVGYVPDELRNITRVLGGSVDGFVDPAGLGADFAAIIERTKGLAVSSAQLQLWTPPAVGAVIKLLSQREPQILDLTGNLKPGTRPGSQRVDLGAWGEESRLYQLIVELPDKSIGQPGGAEKLIARASIIVTENGVETEVALDGKIVAEWTDDDAKSAVINPKVAQATGQGELAAAIQEGVAALNSGEEEKATKALQRAAKLAADTGNEEATQRLKKFIESDPTGEKGTVRLKKGISKADVVDLDTKSTKTRRVR